MNARIDPTLTLEEVAKHIEQWRSHKKNGERIPQPLWNEALGLISTYGISRVSRTLRLSYTELNKRRRVIEEEQRRRDRAEETAFVEIDGALVDQAARTEATAAWMELERPDGMRLRVTLHAQGHNPLQGPWQESPPGQTSVSRSVPGAPHGKAERNTPEASKDQ